MGADDELNLLDTVSSPLRDLIGDVTKSFSSVVANLQRVGYKLDENLVNEDYSSQVKCNLCSLGCKHDSVKWKEKMYHLTCANFWINRVSNQPPN